MARGRSDLGRLPRGTGGDLRPCRLAGPRWEIAHHVGISAVPKVLVSYVDPLDVNAQVAMTIAAQLCQHGIHVELRPVSRVRPSWVYRPVVLGGAVDDQHFGATWVIAVTYPDRRLVRAEQYG